jgi:hypothetical protein
MGSGSMEIDVPVYGYRGREQPIDVGAEGDGLVVLADHTMGEAGGEFVALVNSTKV